MKNRDYTSLDQFCMRMDQALRALSAHQVSTRPSPAKQEKESKLTAEERKLSANLMRVNHAGEVSAQALYHGQSLVSRDPGVQAHLKLAAEEEGDHLAWCNQRLLELGSHTSYLNPFWYTGSFLIGLSAGLIGDKWSLGFVAETERQVILHLQNHLQALPANDLKSAKILEQMQKDEAQHQDDALQAGAAELPGIIQTLMKWASKVMVKTAFWI
jgi:ubiquinone biosynthesis monooxygenase Coq7